MSFDRAQQVKALALRVALSPSFQHFYNSKAAPEVWEKLVATWNDDTLHTMGLILDEEDSMRKEVITSTLRKKKVNQTKLLQRIEQLRMKAHESNQN
jgi:hypothetical protein